MKRGRIFSKIAKEIPPTIRSVLPLEEQRLTFIPDTTVPVTDEAIAAQVMKLYEALDDHDDVQNVYANFEVPEEILNKISATA